MPTFEVEQKYGVSDSKALIGRLKELGFAVTQTQQHRDTYFRHPSRDFRKSDEAFRLRRIDNVACVTYKGPRLPGAVKAREEVELEVQAAECDQWLTMLGRLGFESLPVVCKRREVFESTDTRWSGYVVCLDDVEQLGIFCEIELLVDGDSELQLAREKIELFGEQLELTVVQPLSYLALLLAKLGYEAAGE